MNKLYYLIGFHCWNIILQNMNVLINYFLVPELRGHLDELPRESCDETATHKSDTAKKLQGKNVTGRHVSPLSSSS
jgi:hypothetical protein